MYQPAQTHSSCLYADMWIYSFKGVCTFETVRPAQNLFKTDLVKTIIISVSQPLSP